MTDYFAALGQPHRPWLDEDQLKDRFHQLSSVVHPDRTHGLDESARKSASERYADLNTAYQCLRQPKLRLAHLLLLKRGTKPCDVRDIPNEITDLFSEVGMLLRASAKAAEEKQRVASAIQKAGVLSRALPIIEKISALQSRIQQQRSAVDASLHALDERWVNESGDAALREPLFTDTERLYHHLGFLERWAGQLQERLVQLTL